MNEAGNRWACLGQVERALAELAWTPRGVTLSPLFPRFGAWQQPDRIGLPAERLEPLAG